MKPILAVLLAAIACVGCDPRNESNQRSTYIVNEELTDFEFSEAGDENNFIDIVFFSFEQFSDAVRSSVSTEALDCGSLGAEEDAVVTNTCVGEAFARGEEFFALSRSFGIDSTEGRGITSNGSEVVLWYYSSYPATHPTTGLSYLGSSIESVNCVDGSLTGILEGFFDRVISCDNE